MTVNLCPMACAVALLALRQGLLLQQLAEHQTELLPVLLLLLLVQLVKQQTRRLSRGAKEAASSSAARAAACAAMLLRGKGNRKQKPGPARHGQTLLQKSENGGNHKNRQGSGPGRIRVGFA